LIKSEAVKCLEVKSPRKHLITKFTLYLTCLVTQLSARSWKVYFFGNAIWMTVLIKNVDIKFSVHDTFLE